MRSTIVAINDTLPFKNICIVDKCYITYFTCLLLGIGSLLPYTTLVSAFEYFNENHKPINIILHVSLMNNIFNCASIALLVAFHDNISIKSRIILCNLATAFVFVIIPNNAHGYAFLLSSAAFCGATLGILSVSVIEYGQLFTKK